MVIPDIWGILTQARGFRLAARLLSTLGKEERKHKKTTRAKQVNFIFTSPYFIRNSRLLIVLFAAVNFRM